MRIAMSTEQRFTFDEVAELYDRYRPSYPEEIFEDLIAASGISSGERILEIGCGTGQATRSLAQRGFSIEGLEPGADLAHLAARNLAEFPKVEILSLTFEEWPVAASTFGLVVSAQAFHWLTEDLRFSKSAEALRSGGSLAVMGNALSSDRSCHGDAGGAVGEALDDAYRLHAPSLLKPSVTAWYGESGPIPGLFETSGCFEPATATCHPWSHRYETTEYLGLLATQSEHRLLPSQQRALLHDAIAEALERFGGGIEIFYAAHVYVAKRKN